LVRAARVGADCLLRAVSLPARAAYLGKGSIYQLGGLDGTERGKGWSRVPESLKLGSDFGEVLTKAANSVGKGERTSASSHGVASG